MRRSVDEEQQSGGSFVQSLERGLAVIRAFDADHREMTLSEVGRATGLTRATARRFLLTLESLGYVSAQGGRFSLRPRVLELGFSYLSTLSLTDVASPHMERFVVRVNESSSIAVLDDLDIVYVVRVPTRRIMSIVIAVGTRLPAWVTSMGRVLLADLPDDRLEEHLSRVRIEPYTSKTVGSIEELRAAVGRAREQRWALVDQELEMGLRSAAVPIREPDGTVGSAINVSVHAGRTSAAELRKTFLPQLRDCAAAIEADLRAAGTGARALPRG
jgi:IclR family transcriptional regulator, pca regulon regulatory protein